jgi:hypothetical protein
MNWNLQTIIKKNKKVQTEIQDHCGKIKPTLQIKGIEEEEEQVKGIKTFSMKTTENCSVLWKEIGI